MVNESQNILITKEAVSVDELKIIKPTIVKKEPVTAEEEIVVGLKPIIPRVVPTPPEEVVPTIPITPPPFIPGDFLSSFTPKEFRPVKAPFEAERDLIINIETTGLLPFESRIFSIAYLDLTNPNNETQVLISDNEEELINAFFNIYDNGNFTRIIGWNISFDYRFLFSIACLYRRPVPKFYNASLRDVQQIYQQVKEQYVYGFQKPNKLTEWATFLLGIGKLMPQKDLLKKYLEGDFETVNAFQRRQIEMTKGLYDLARFVQSASPTASNQSNPESTLTPEPISNIQNPGNPGEKKCRNCLQLNPKDATECIICGDKL